MPKRTILSRRLLILFFWSAVLSHCVAIGVEKYQLVGKITLKEREFSRNALPLVLLEGTRIPFAAHTHADLAGIFKFNNLRPDSFTLTVYIPHAGEYRRTVEVSPGLADSRKRVFVDIDFEANLGSKTPLEVSSARLSISEDALKEYEKAGKKLGRSDPEGAIAHLKKAVTMQPQFVDAWNMLGTLAYKTDQFSLAEGYFREALRHEPDYYPALVNLGGALLSQGKLQESLPVNKAAVQARPDDALAHSQLGWNFYYLQDFAEAEKSLKQATLLDPGHFSYPQLALAEIYLWKQDFTSAEHELKQFLVLHPDAEQVAAIKERIGRIRSQLYSNRSR
jgi:tetratricopeptide (TPR) repeat protein